jgi:hypothetical protein
MRLPERIALIAGAAGRIGRSIPESIDVARVASPLTRSISDHIPGDLW